MLTGEDALPDSQYFLLGKSDEEFYVKKLVEKHFLPLGSNTYVSRLVKCADLGKVYVYRKGNRLLVEQVGYSEYNPLKSVIKIHTTVPIKNIYVTCHLMDL